MLYGHVLLKVVNSFADASLAFLELSMSLWLPIMICDLAHERRYATALGLLRRIVVNTRRGEFLLAG